MVLETNALNQKSGTNWQERPSHQLGTDKGMSDDGLYHTQDETSDKLN